MQMVEIDLSMDKVTLSSYESLLHQMEDSKSILDCILAPETPQLACGEVRALR